MSNHLKIPGSAIEALLDHKLGLSGVDDLSGSPYIADRDVALPQRVVGGQPPESYGDLAEDIDEEVVVILFTKKYEIRSIY